MLGIVGRIGGPGVNLGEGGRAASGVTKAESGSGSKAEAGSSPGYSVSEERDEKNTSGSSAESGAEAERRTCVVGGTGGLFRDIRYGFSRLGRAVRESAVDASGGEGSGSEVGASSVNEEGQGS